MEVTSLANFTLHLRKLANNWAILALVFIGLVLLPIVSVFMGLFNPVSVNWQHIVHTLLKDYIINTILITIATSSLTILLGVSTAWAVTQYSFTSRKLLQWALILPLSIPTYIAAYAYAGIFSFNGVFAQLTHQHFNIIHLPGLALVLSFVLYPYVYLISRSSFAIQSRQHLDAARMLGKSPLAIFFQVALPLSRTAIFGGVILVVMELLNDYGAMKYFGIATFTTGIFRAWFSIGDLNSAIRLASCLGLFVITLFVFEKWQRGKARFTDRTQQSYHSTKISLSGYKQFIVITLCLIPIFGGFVFPFTQLAIWCYQTAAQTVNAHFAIMILNSCTLAALAACTCVFVALAIQFAQQWTGSATLSTLSRATTIGYAIPGAVIAIGVLIPLIAFGKPLKQLGIDYTLIINDTIIILIFAYLVRFLAVSFNAVQSSYRKLPNHVTDVSRLLGKNATTTLSSIHLPLIKGGLLTAFLLVFVDVMKELPLTLILRPFNYDTLATKAFELAGDDRIAEAANPAIIIIIVGLLPIFLLNKMLVNDR